MATKRRKADVRAPEPAAGADLEAGARKWARTAGGRVKALFVIDPEQERALREEARQRADARGAWRPDASEVLREILGDWLKRRAKR